mgnify:FL=1
MIFQDNERPIKAIAAMSINRVIGNDEEIPWHLPEDFKWFKECTLNQVVVMGRVTIESIGKPLPKRETVLVSRSAKAADYPGMSILRDPEQVTQIDTDKEIWICGGAEIYEATLPLWSELYLTVVKQKVKGDTYFPAFEPFFERPETLRENEDMIIYRFLARSSQ